MSQNNRTGSLSTVNQLPSNELIARARSISEQGWNLPLGVTQEPSVEHPTQSPRRTKRKTAKVASRTR
jgi:hypothetical protein